MAMNLAGSVYDELGAPVNGATVTVKNEVGATVASTTTGPTGAWSVLTLTATDAHTVEVTLAGSQMRKIWGDIRVQVGEIVVIDKLELANGGVFVLPASSISTAALADGAVTAAKLAPDVARTNLLVNGGFEIWQRGNGPFTAGGVSTADRWSTSLVASSISMTRITSTIGSKGYSAQFVYTHVGGGSIQLLQRLENYLELRNKTITFSVKVKSSIPGTVFLSITDDVVSSGSIYNAGTGEETLVATLTLSPASAFVEVKIGMNTASSTVEINDAMLVIGFAAATYVPLTPAEEWARCERYYRVLISANAAKGLSLGQQVSTTVSVFWIRFPRMAVAPTLVVVDPTGFRVELAGVSNVDVTGISAGEATVHSIVLTAIHAAYGAISNAVNLRTDAGTTGTLALEANP